MMIITGIKYVEMPRKRAQREPKSPEDKEDFCKNET
jgi:hypothetical protein